MTKFEEEFNYLIELSGKVLIGQVDAEAFEKNRIAFFEKYETDQQQALPVVPECVAGAIESIPDHYSAFEAISLINTKVNALPEENEDWLPVYNWLCEGIENQDIFALAFITGKYEVEKPQLFCLKHIDMSKSDAHLNWYLAKGTDNVLIHQGIKKGKLPKLKCILKLTQQEIDSMQTGSYELVPVEDGE
ncbi:hypothetical protein Li1_1198 [Lactococcus lactis subsp. lactis]|uniref:DUF1642 domain-containing protein n=1 Tax=Lactococcus lactis TaxID=1358 RepID=UPI00071DD7BA|nr:DUF1642 domain-containing protein [Lactococcus lactis]KSU06633.1 hypothetical protein Li1_1198 [Lactococcus lactis subsp. lactis]